MDDGMLVAAMVCVSTMAVCDNDDDHSKNSRKAVSLAAEPLRPATCSRFNLALFGYIGRQMRMPQTMPRPVQLPGPDA